MEQEVVLQTNQQPISRRTVVSVSEAQRDLMAVIEQVRKTHDHAVVQSNGTPVAVLLSMAEYEQLLGFYRRKAAFYDLAHGLGHAVEELGMSEEEFMAELEVTKREVFSEQYGRSA